MKQNIKKILIGIIILAVGISAGYFLMPEKVEVVTVIETETKYVTVTDKKQVDSLTMDINALRVQIIALQVEKAAIQLQMDELNAQSDEAYSQLKAFRVIEVEGWISKLERKIVRFESRIEPIDAEIEVLQDEIVLQQKAISLLQAQISSKQLLMQALIADDPIGNLAQIRLLEDEIIVINADISAIESIIDGINDDITSKYIDKEVLQDKITLDEKCISEITRYINDATEFSSEVEKRLEALGLI